MKKSLFTSFTLCLVIINSFAQTPCEQKLKNAKNSIIAIVNSGGGNDKINQTAADVMTNMALNCPEMVDEFNKFIQSLSKKGNTDMDLDGKVKGDYQTNQERQKAWDEYNKQTNRNLAGQGTSNNSNQNNNNSNRTGNNQSGMRGDGYAELPFKENDNKNSTIQYTNGDDDWIDTKKTIRKNSTNGGGIGISGKTVEQQRQNEQYRNQAHNQIQNGKGGFKPVENKRDLISPKGSLESEIQNFEKKLANVPENLKPDLLAKANHILNTVTNQTEAARKLANLMTEFEKVNGKVIQTKTPKINEKQPAHWNSTLTNKENAELDNKFKLENEMGEHANVWRIKVESVCKLCNLGISRDYKSLIISSIIFKENKEAIYKLLNQNGKKILKENAEGDIYFIP